MCNPEFFKLKILICTQSLHPGRKPIPQTLNPLLSPFNPLLKPPPYFTPLDPPNSALLRSSPNIHSKAYHHAPFPMDPSTPPLMSFNTFEIYQQMASPEYTGPGLSPLIVPMRNLMMNIVPNHILNVHLTTHRELQIMFSPSDRDLTVPICKYHS